ncbi:MAG: protein kinase, partial [Chloroflexota bacterium]|nr:protein kinase [Chloroflexota bacterium]
MTKDLRDQLQSALGGAYAIERELGGGGMSRVFLAEEAALGRRVVIKVLPPELAGSVNTERFRREILLAARLRHPLVVPILVAGEADGLLYFTMPYVEGESLRTRLCREGRLPVADAVPVMRDVAEALCYAHRHGVVHRDIKPENTLLDSESGHALVTDFGVAKALSAATTSQGGLTSIGMALGTPAYMAPEQALGDPATDHRADLYALGAVAYEVLTGKPPFSGNTPQELIGAHVAQPPEPLSSRRPDIAPVLAALIMQLLEKRAEDRPQSATELLGELEVVATSDNLASRAEPTPQAQAAAPLRMGARWRVVLVVGGVLSLGLLGYGAVSLAGKGRTTGAASQAVAAPGEGTDSRGKSVAVLPFVNLSPERENEYFADGMTEELIGALSKVQGLRVPARTSVFALKGKDLDARAIGDTLKVATVLEGSVRRSGGRLRVGAQLVSAKDNGVLWSETYDRDLADVFQVQDELARAIVGALRLQLKLTNRADTALVEAPTEDLEAYNLYLQGRYVWNRRTYESLLKAARYFERAVERDSTYAQAYAGLADAYVLLPAYGPARPKEAFSKARRAAERALALDSTLAEAHTSLAYSLELADYDWAGAEAAFRRAIALNPNYATAHHWYAEYLSIVGRHQEALAEFERARALDPLSRIISADRGLALARAGRYDDAIRELRATLELDPNFFVTHVFLCSAYLSKRRPREAVPECERAAALSRRNGGLGHLAYAYA